MTDTPSATFELVFAGQTLPGADIQKVRNNAAKLFKAGPEQLDKLFSGKPVVLKNNLNQATAEGYQQKLKSAGLICELRSMPTKPHVEATSITSPPSPESTPEPAPEQTSGWSLAPAGADVNPHEPEPTPPMPDTSQFSLKEQKGYLFDKDNTPTPATPDTSHITLE